MKPKTDPESAFESLVCRIREANPAFTVLDTKGRSPVDASYTVPATPQLGLPFDLVITAVDYPGDWQLHIGGCLLAVEFGSSPDAESQFEKLIKDVLHGKYRLTEHFLLDMLVSWTIDERTGTDGWAQISVRTPNGGCLGFRRQQTKPRPTRSVVYEPLKEPKEHVGDY